MAARYRDLSQQAQTLLIQGECLPPALASERSAVRDSAADDRKREIYPEVCDRPQPGPLLTTPKHNTNTTTQLEASLARISAQIKSLSSSSSSSLPPPAYQAAAPSSYQPHPPPPSMAPSAGASGVPAYRPSAPAAAAASYIGGVGSSDRWGSVLLGDPSGGGFDGGGGGGGGGGYGGYSSSTSFGGGGGGGALGEGGGGGGGFDQQFQQQPPFPGGFAKEEGDPCSKCGKPLEARVAKTEGNAGRKVGGRSVGGGVVVVLYMCVEGMMIDTLTVPHMHTHTCTHNYSSGSASTATPTSAGTTRGRRARGPRRATRRWCGARATRSRP